MSKIVVKCGPEWLQSESLKILKEFTKLGYSEIGKRINERNPIAEIELFLNDYQEVEESLSWFMVEAEGKNLPFEIYELSPVEEFSELKETEQYKITSQMLRNIFAQSKETKKQIEDEDEIRFHSK
jgi:hypothetical protein